MSRLISYRTPLGSSALLAVLVAAATAGCAKSKPKADTEAATATPAASEQPARAVADPLTAALQAMVDNCTINEQHAVISKCKGNEKQKLVRDFSAGKLSRAKSLPALVEALAGADKPLSVAASKTLEAAFRNSLGDIKAADLNQEIATKLLGLLTSLPKRQASQIAPAAVHVAMLSGKSEELYRVLDTQPSKDLRASAYVYLLRYGTLAELPKIKSLIDGDDPRVAASALEALRRVPGANEEQKKQICDFVSPLLTDTRPSVLGKAVSLLTTCGGNYVDQALTEADKRLAAGTVNAPFVRGFDQLCLDRRGKTYGSEAQCKQERRWLESALANKQVNDEVRQFALLGLGLQFPDEKTRKLAQTYIKSDDKRLKSAAQRVTRSVETKLRAADKNAAKQADNNAASPAAAKPTGATPSPARTAAKAPQVPAVQGQASTPPAQAPSATK